MNEQLDPEHDQLDRLLGLAPMPQPDPWFTARTVARCRLSEPSADHFSFFRSMSFWSRWALPAFCVLFAGGLSLQQAHRIHTLKVHHRQDRVREAFEAMVHVDKDPDSSWPDSSL